MKNDEHWNTYPNNSKYSISVYLSRFFRYDLSPVSPSSKHSAPCCPGAKTAPMARPRKRLCSCKAFSTCIRSARSFSVNPTMTSQRGETCWKVVGISRCGQLKVTKKSLSANGLHTKYLPFKTWNCTVTPILHKASESQVGKALQP